MTEATIDRRLQWLGQLPGVRGVEGPFTPWWAQRLASRSPAPTRVFVAGRQIGKTYWAANEVLKVACAEPGTKSVVVAPTYKIAEAAIQRLRQIGAAIPHAAWKEQKKQLVLPNGSVVEVYSADRSDQVARGPTVSGVLWFDEAAYLREAARDAALGGLVTSKGRSIRTTTPAGKNWIYREFKEAGDPHVARFHVRSVDSPFTNRELLGRLRAGMTLERAAQEFDAAFLDDLRLVFPDVSKLFVHSLPDRRSDKDLQHVLGLDLGNEQDWCVATLMNKYGEARVLGRWQRVEWPETQKRVASMAHAFRAVVVLDHGSGSGSGDVLKDYLRREGVTVFPVKTGVLGEKARIVEQLQSSVQWEQVKVLENEYADQLRHELLLFQATKRPNSAVTAYEGPQLDGEHDDCVISLALANWGRTRGPAAGEAIDEVEELKHMIALNEAIKRRFSPPGTDGPSINPFFPLA